MCILYTLDINYFIAEKLCEYFLISSSTLKTGRLPLNCLMPPRVPWSSWRFNQQPFCQTFFAKQSSFLFHTSRFQALAVKVPLENKIVFYKGIVSRDYQNGTFFAVLQFRHLLKTSPMGCRLVAEPDDKLLWPFLLSLIVNGEIANKIEFKIPPVVLQILPWNHPWMGFIT